MWSTEAGGGPLELVILEKFNPALPSLLMVHGAGGSALHFRPLTRALAGRVNAAALSLPGHGQTPGPAFDKVEDTADWLMDFIGRGKVRPVILGHSMGGAVSLTLAAKAPHLLRGLILVCTGEELRVSPDFIEALQNDFRTALEGVCRASQAAGTDQRMLELGIELMAANGQETVVRDFQACGSYRGEDLPSRVTVPTLVVGGELDLLAPPYLSRDLARDIPGAELLMLDDGDHMLPIGKAPTLAEAVLDFMGKY